MNLTNNKVVLGVSIFAGLLLTYYLASVVVPKTLVTFTKAAPSQVVSITNSYLLGARILAKADGKDKCLVNVFVLDATGKGISGKTVTLSGAEGIRAKGLITDTDGKVTFEITSKVEGQFALKAEVSGVVLPREIKVTFRD